MKVKALRNSTKAISILKNSMFLAVHGSPP